MKIKGFLLWSIFIIVVGVILESSTWLQWSANQETVLERMRPVRPIAEFNHGARTKDLEFSPTNHDVLASAGDDNYIKLWKRNEPDMTKDLLFESDEDLFDIDFLQTDDLLFCKGLHRETILCNTITGKKVKLPMEETTWDSTVSPSAERRATVHPQRVVLWNIQNLNEMSITNVITEIHHTTYHNSFRCVDFSPDEKWFAVGYENGDIRIWDIEKEQFIKTLSVPHESHVHLRDITFSPDGRWIVVLEHMSLTIWDTQNSLRHVLLDWHVGFLREVKFSQDGRYMGIKTHEERGGFIIWSLPDVSIYHQMSEGIISRIAISPDGLLLAVSNPGEVTLMSLDSLTPIAILKGEGFLGGAHEITFSHDGSMLAGGGSGGVLRIWNVKDYYEK